MVQHHPVQLAKRLHGRVHHFGRNRKVSQVATDHLHLLVVLLLELLEGFDAAGYDNDVVGPWCVQEVLCDSETDAYLVSFVPRRECPVFLPREAPVTIRVLAVMVYCFCFFSQVVFVQECADGW